MESEDSSNNGSCADSVGGDKDAAIREVVSLGEIVWVELYPASWWPSQIADDKSVPPSRKPAKRIPGTFLVRLYGSYTYMYVDVVKCRTEFKKVLEQHNGNVNEIMDKTLEQDMARIRSGSARGGGRKQEGKPKTGSPKGKKLKQTIARDTGSPISATKSAANSNELSTRRIRVMQGLGLIAPPGSPFRRKVCTNSNSSLCG